jgi:YtxH-like protein
MSYVSPAANPSLRSSRPGIGRPLPADLDGVDDITEPVGHSYAEPIDWARLGVFGLGIALGALLGSGAALLLAPQSGEEARAGITRRARAIRTDARDAWDDLREELDWAAQRGRKRLGRGITRGAWAAEDLVDRGRHRIGL